MSIRILVVDDNPDILANVRDFLSMKDGWAPETASTGSRPSSASTARPSTSSSSTWGCPTPTA